MAARTNQTDDTLKQVALLLSQGRTQKQIHKQIGISQTSVSRAKAAAILKGYLVERFKCRLDATERERLECQIHRPGLLERLQKLQPADQQNLRLLRILHVDPARRPYTEQQLLRYRDDFGREVAMHLLRNVFPQVPSIGVTWGGTLLSVVRGIDEAIGDRRQHLHIEFLPVCGAPPDAIEAALRSSSYLVASLDARLTNTTSNPNNFTGVSAAISSKFTTRERLVVEKYFHQNKGYGRVFGRGKRRGRIDEMAAVMTGVGSSDFDDPWVKGGAEAAGIEPALLSRLVLGNIGGWFLPRHDLDKRRRTIVDRVNARWTGIQLEHYLACSSRARPRKNGGTILISSGKKAEIVLECIRHGLIAELLVDTELAVGLGTAIGFRQSKA